MSASPVSDAERLARVGLNRLLEPGDVRLLELLPEYGVADLYRRLCTRPGSVGRGIDVGARLRGLDPEAELTSAARSGIRFVCPGDPEWPERLSDLDTAEPLQRVGGAPLGLWVKGPARLDRLCERSVAVVGSRSATGYGAGVAGGIAAELVRAGFTVLSGAAFGIDQAAHRGALGGGGITVAVLACGADRAYPVAHQDLLGHIAKTGLVVSELPCGCAPTRSRFLARNRLIAALTAGTVVVEAAARSGALNTANWAGRLSRVLMGVPGPVTSAPSEGVHELIRSQGAVLVTGGADVLELVSPAGSFLSSPPRGRQQPRDRLTPDQQRVLDAVPAASPAPTRSVARAAGLGTATVAGCLETLLGRGLVKCDDGGWRLGRR